MDLETMKEVDIRTVDINTLKDIKDVQINMDKPQKERMMDYIEQIGNPYCFRCGKIAVKVSYSDTDLTMEKCMEAYFRSL